MNRSTRLVNGYNERAGKLWSIYTSKADQFDSNRTESWKDDIDSTLIFAGLFSATVTAFIIESSQMLKQDPSDVTNALLTHILAVSLVPANTNSSIVLPSELPTFVFKPSPSAVTVNILWYLSLTCSLVAALCVILVQKWVQDYLHRIQRHSQPLRRARVRAFLYDGTKKWKMYLIVKYIPTLLHISLFLFFAGLYIFLFHINLAVSRAVAAVILLCLMFYAFATIVPLFDPSAPYETPLTAPLWRFIARFAYHHWAMDNLNSTIH